NLQRGWGGAEQHTLMLSRGLQARGVYVVLACHPAGELRRRAADAGIPTAPVTVRNQMDPTAGIRLGAKLRSHRLDLLHLHSPKEYLAGPTAAKVSNAGKVVLTRHILLKLKPPMVRLYNSVDAVVACSGLARDALRRYGVEESRLAVIRGGTDISPFLGIDVEQKALARKEFLVPPGAISIGTTSRLERCKGHAVLLEALCRIGNRHSILLLVAGAGDQLAALQQQAADLGVASHVRFLGFCTEIARVLAAADIAVLATIDPELEQYPISVMEAMAAGLPQVATRVGALEDMVTQEVTGLLVEPGSSTELAAALERLICDSQGRQKMGAAARVAARERFAMDTMIDDAMNLYSRLLAGAGRHQVEAPDSMARR
ncbi:MAG TPA: glycosyltransferase family 4 protein, partial [Chthonomonadales bacterium]|nr:glycosyltransferase family 4 protein [Chthonomonadales bacterium]